MSANGEVPVEPSSETVNMNDNISKVAPDEVEHGPEMPLTPHPFYDHCSEPVKRFIIVDILPIARQYAVVYHSHEVSEESKEPYKHAYEARKHLHTCLELTNSILESTEQREWEQEYIESDRNCLQMLKNFIQYKIGTYIHSVTIYRKSKIPYRTS